MSQKSKNILSKSLLGVFAMALTLGAAELASGRDLTETAQDSSVDSSLGTSAVINRAAKSDRSSAITAAERTQTIALRFDGLPDTSVLIRMPVVQEARNGVSAPSRIKSGDRRMAVACEPFVSVLTEIAKQLQPGRCVT